MSRDTCTVLKQCAIHIPELLPRVSWCYSQHQYLWHPMGKLISASGVQQGDPLGPLLFALVLNDTVTKIAQDPLCGSLQSNFWYLGTKVSTVKGNGHHTGDSISNGLLINFKKANYLASRITQCSILRFCVAQHQILRFLVLPLAAMISALPLLKGSGRKPTNYYSFCLSYVTPSLRLLSSGYVQAVTSSSLNPTNHCIVGSFCQV